MSTTDASRPAQRAEWLCKSIIPSRLESIAEALRRNTDAWARLFGEDVPFVVAQRSHVVELHDLVRMARDP